MDFRKHFHIVILALSLFPLIWTGCGGAGGGYVSRRARFSSRRWMRYEFHNSKTFSYGESQVKEGMKVIGYEPSWLIYDSLYLRYPYELLSDLVIGEYDVNPVNGFPRGDSSHIAFKKKDIVELASAINSQLNILLAVTDYGDFARRKEFLPEASKKNLINSLDQLLGSISLNMGNEDGREHIGLLFDFPKVRSSQRRDYLTFVERVKKSLNDEEQQKTCLIYVVLPADDRYRIYSDSIFSARMQKVADGFLLRTHIFDENLGNGLHGPMLPMLNPGGLSLDSIVTYYTEKGHFPSNRLVMEIPYYGKVFVNDSTMAPKRPLIPLAELMNTVEGPRQVDSLSYCFFKELDTLKYYYDDTLSIEMKYNWMAQRGLGGVGLYGMGYGIGMDELPMEEGLWRLIAENFTEPAPRLLFPAVGFLLSFIGFGIIASVISFWQVRFALRDQRKKFWYYIALMTWLIITIIFMALPVQTIPVMWKLVALVVLLIFPLGKGAVKYLSKAK